MNIHRTNRLPASVEEITADRSYHVVTDAHVGFSVLHTFGRAFNVSTPDCKAFAASVNNRDEAGSMFPNACISAIPRKSTRDDSSAEKNAAVSHLKDFLSANEESMKASKIIMDFQGFLSKDIMAKALEGFASSVVTDVYLVGPS
jgi:hypothetical protein